MAPCVACIGRTRARGGPIKTLIENIARALADHPEDVQVTVVEGSQVTVLELRAHPEDVGKIIGREGRTAKAIRTILGAAGMKLRRRFTLEIVDGEERTASSAR